MSEKLEKIVNRPGALPKTHGKPGPLLRRVREEQGDPKLQGAIRRSPLFRGEKWAKLVHSTLTAIHRILGERRPVMPGQVHRPEKRPRAPVSPEKVERAQRALERLVRLLGEVTEGSVAARIIQDKLGHKRLKAEARRYADERSHSLTSEHDVALYPSQFIKDNPILRLR